MENIPRQQVPWLVTRLGTRDAASALGIQPVLAAHVATGGDAPPDVGALARIAVLR